MKVDIVRELIMRLLSAAHREGSLTESIALEVERSFRQEYAGEKFYVSKSSPVEIEQRQKSVVDAYLKSDASPEEVADENGVSRATMYRYLKR